MAEFTQDYKDLINERFDGLAKLMNARLENIEDKIERTLEQATKTNSRVNHLEDDVIELEKKVDEAIIEAHHVIDTRSTNCPNLPRIESMEKEVRTIGDWKTAEIAIEEKEKHRIDTFFKKYGALVATVLMLATLFFGGRNMRKINTDMSTIKSEMMLQNEMMLDGGGADYIKNRTRGAKLDTLNIDSVKDGNN